MAQIKIKQKFPCGFEYEIEAKSFLGINSNEFEMLKECPMHKNKCKKEEGSY